MPQRKIFLHTLSRKQALFIGLKRYFTGKPCKHGHIDFRKSSNGECFSCNRIQFKSYSKRNANKLKEKRLESYAKNPETYRERQRVYTKKNKGAVMARQALWREKNREHQINYAMDYKRKNRSKARKIESDRRARKLQAIPLWYEENLISIVYKKGKELGLEVDHIVPLGSSLVCGLHCWDNLQLLDKSLNSRKNNNYWPDMP